MKRRHQPPVRGGRDPLPSCVTGDLWLAVNTDAVRHGVSRSWVIATILGHHYDIETAPFPVAGKGAGKERGR